MRKQESLVIIGNGMVGFKFIEKLTEADRAGLFHLTTFCEEPVPAYDRVHLSDYFNGKTAVDLQLAPISWYTERGITLHLEDAVVTIHRDEKGVLSRHGRTIPYDRLVMATGSAPFVPPLPGVEKKGVFVYRTLQDLDNIMAYSRTCQTAAVIGGGLLGLEAAKALHDLGLDTHIVEMSPRLMPRQIDQAGSDVLQRKIGELGVTVHLGKTTSAFTGNGRAQGLQFTNGDTLMADIIVISAGIKPRDELARAAGLEVGSRGGIMVNDFMQTSDPAIYAIGECALHREMIYGLAAPGYRMAETAVAHLLPGEKKAFTGADLSTKLKCLGVDVASIGDAQANGTHENVIVSDSHAGVYKKLMIDPHTHTLTGAILVGDTGSFRRLFQFYQQQTPLPAPPESLIAQGGHEAGTGVASLPDDAQICSCENVGKGQIMTAVARGCHDLPTLKRCTKAGTGCGSCVPLVKELLTTELEKVGIVTDHSLCEHFAYTRQELGQIIKAAQIQTFDELLGRYGRGGTGCEICKPAVASLLASYRNDYILEHQNIQDTNDTYLANIQKNGTYSIVPRVPGGEITPKQLIAIGEIAHDFNLYTKITGGQRIDLFGARLEELPLIWARLHDVGLESGHAYAKGLRTVKSCVGQAWCRFGVQDSTALAIRLENRYKGIRFPHKVKMAVSGCARECAEAQSKDVGVIASEKGWNLYLGGNGGMKPQHAVLFATDLDEGMLICTIDRFLMYYTRTADRLMRTATWLNKLPGGLGHLRQVIQEDTLGICAELEAEMAYLVSTYQDEWGTTLASPENLKRFKHFLNVPDSDPTIRFELVRGQRQPIT